MAVGNVRRVGDNAGRVPRFLDIVLCRYYHDSRENRVAKGCLQRLMAWQVTLTSIYCDRVEEYVSLSIRQDRNATCGWFNRHSTADTVKDRATKKKLGKCEGLSCDYIGEFLDRARSAAVED